MTYSGRYGVAFAGNSVGIDWQGQGALAILDFLYLNHAVGPTDVAAAGYRLVSLAGGAVDLGKGGKTLYRGTDAGAVAGILLDQSIHALADPCVGGLLLHAGAVAWRDQGILMPAASGSGKTTTAAWLTHQGFDYLSDELVFLGQGSLHLQAFHRPLHLKTAAVGAVQRATGLGLNPSDKTSDRILASRQGLLVQPALFNRTTTYSTPDLAAIVFPRYRADAGFSLTRLARAQAGMRLMGCLVNARNLAGHGFNEVTRVCRRVPAYTMEYAEVTQIRDAIFPLLAAHGAPE